MAIFRQGWWAAWMWVRVDKMDQGKIPDCPYSTAPIWMSACRDEWARGWNAYFAQDDAIPAR